MDTIKFGWGNEYAITECFDLNSLRQLQKVKKVGKTYMPKDDDDSEITITVGINYSNDEESNTKTELEEAIKEKDTYNRYWSEARTEHQKVKAELDCLKKAVEIMKKEEAE